MRPPWGTSCGTVIEHTSVLARLAEVVGPAAGSTVGFTAGSTVGLAIGSTVGPIVGRTIGPSVGHGLGWQAGGRRFSIQRASHGPGCASCFGRVSDNNGTAEGSIIAAIMMAHIANTSARSAPPQLLMRGISHHSAATSMFSIPQAI